MRLLDLFCGGGGCSVGYRRAGFTEIVGVDNRPMPRYPFEFVECDSLRYLAAHGSEFDAIHASPPCQAYSQTKTIWNRSYPDLVPETRELLQKIGRPWVIENVQGAPMGAMFNAITLCGTMFDLRVKRHRLFESSEMLMSPGRTCAHPPPGSFVQVGCKANEGDWMIVAGHFSSLPAARKAMGIDWMSRNELAQAIPPAYTEFIGRQLMAILENRRD